MSTSNGSSNNSFYMDENWKKIIKLFHKHPSGTYSFFHLYRFFLQFKFLPSNSSYLYDRFIQSYLLPTKSKGCVLTVDHSTIESKVGSFLSFQYGYNCLVEEKLTSGNEVLEIWYITFLETVDNLDFGSLSFYSEHSELLDRIKFRYLTSIDQVTEFISNLEQINDKKLVIIVNNVDEFLDAEIETKVIKLINVLKLISFNYILVGGFRKVFIYNNNLVLSLQKLTLFVLYNESGEKDEYRRRIEFSIEPKLKYEIFKFDFAVDNSKELIVQYKKVIES